ncbi:glutamate receptor ionotropic, kainate 1-like, partial [Phymastichus coffea]|uniref:glutamate receptor ionotropic, kainate 1-like n=1 Tax=Phymastichus coffea TaxID=108790 RepID=UPI00273CA207
MISLYLVVVLVLHSECLEESHDVQELLPKPVIGAFLDESESTRQAFSLAVHTVNKCTYDHKICEKICPTDSNINKRLFHQVEFSTMTAQDDNEIPVIRQNFAKLAGMDHKDDTSIIKNEKGLSFVIGPHESISSLYVQGLCELYNLPQIVIRRENEREHSASQTINLYPDTETVNNVFLDLIKKMGWQTFSILYEDTNNFIALRNILAMYRYTHSVYGIKLAGHGSNYSEPLLKAKSLQHKSFLIDCGFDILDNVLTQLQEVGMMTGDYRYVITTLDLHAIDWRQYQYSGVNIKGFQLIDFTNPFVRDFLNDYLDVFKIESVEQFRLDDALIFDAVMMFAHAYKDLSYKNGQLFSATFSKDFDKEFYPWKEGLSLRNYLLYTEIMGLTGPIAIDGDGARRRFKLDLMTLHETGLKKHCEWNFENYFVDFRHKESREKPHYKVLITNNPPYAMVVKHSRSMAGNERYEGLVVDIIKELSKALDFDYTLIMHSNTNNGNCKWEKLSNYTSCISCDGVTGRVFNGEVDMAISDLTMTENRAKCVQFSTPFMNLGISLLVKKPQKVVTLFSFLAPFHYQVWLCIALSTIVMSILFFALGRLCPAEWTNPYPCIEEPNELQNQFTFNNAVWFTVGAILQQGSEIAPMQ